MTLSQLLDIRPGVTAVIGGGGKTTLLRTLGEELAGQHPVLLCTTTKILPFSDLPCARTAAELDELRRAHQLLCAGTDEPGTGKLTAPETPMAVLAEQFDYILVEADGVFHQLLDIGAQVRQGDVAATVNGVPMTCTLDGVLRGILPDGTPVHKGMKAGDIDPRCKVEHCYTASDKALAIGGGVLEAILDLTGALKDRAGGYSG